MTRKISLFFGLLVALNSSAFAWTGGPFSNNTYSSLIEANGTYQATFTFRNGNGYAYFSTDNDLSGSASLQSTQQSVSISSSQLSTSNRSVFYYKGITYVGMATGTSDYTARTITGFANAFSEYTSSSSASSSGGGGASSVSSSSTVVSNTGTNSYAANATFTAKITDTAPEVRFEGTGQLAIVSPDGFEEISEALGDFLTDAYETIAENISTVTEDVNSLLVENQLPLSFNTVVTIFDTQSSTTTNTISAINPLTGAVTAVSTTTTTPVTTADSTELEVLFDAYTLAEVNNALSILNAVNANATTQFQDLFDQAAIDLENALTPPTSEEVSENQTEYVNMKVYGYLKTFQ